MRRTLVTVCLALALPRAAAAQEEGETGATRPLEATAAQPVADADPRGAVQASGRASLVLSGYAETFWQWNFNAPGNGVTAWRGFDNRHNAFTLSNVVLDAAWRYRVVQGRVALQVGHTPESYYQAEPARRAVPGAGATGPDVWKFVQQANVGARAGRFLFEGGLFLSPVGPESMAVRDNWNWSRSNLFFGLPYYHTGLRVTYAPSGRHALTLGVFNGWNSVVDNNAAKSVMLQYAYTPSDETALSLLYLGGVERDDVDPAGAGWRNLFDAYARFRATRWLSVTGHVNGGFEVNDAGVSSWAAFAAYLRFDLSRAVRLALRGDFFLESAPAAQHRIFWPADWMTSQTATLEVAPVDHLLVRVEYRHDIAEAPAFYRGEFTDGSSLGLSFNARSQDTLTAGMVAWF